MDGHKKITEKGNKCKIPYQKQTAEVAGILLIIFGFEIWFPLWCVYTSYAIVLAVSLYWSIYAYLHKDRKAATKYLLLTVLFVIVFALMIYIFDIR